MLFYNLSRNNFGHRSVFYYLSSCNETSSRKQISSRVFISKNTN